MFISVLLSWNLSFSSHYLYTYHMCIRTRCVLFSFRLRLIQIYLMGQAGALAASPTDAAAYVPYTALAASLPSQSAVSCSSEPSSISSSDSLGQSSGPQFSLFHSLISTVPFFTINIILYVFLSNLQAPVSPCTHCRCAQLPLGLLCFLE